MTLVYFFNLEITLNYYTLNYTFTHFELDNEEATVSILFMYIVTLSVVCKLKKYNPKDQSNA